MTDAQALERLLAYRADGWYIEMGAYPPDYFWDKFSLAAHREGYRERYGCGNTLAEAVEDLAGEIEGKEAE